MANVTAGNILLIDVQGCARCDQNHPQIVFRLMQRPIDPLLPYYGICPLTREPILVGAHYRGDGA
jgi:hypothetical protein